MSVVEIACLIAVGVVTWMVASEGIWGAAQTFLCTLLAGLVAMNFFEPLANMLRSVIPENYCDIVALLGLFTGLLFGLRMGTEHLSPSYIQVIPMLDTVGRKRHGPWAFASNSTVINRVLSTWVLPMPSLRPSCELKTLMPVISQIFL